MDLGELKRHWDGFAKTDPLWSILTVPGTEGRRWDAEKFYETGRTEIHVDLHLLEEMGVTVRRTSALDFGCGVGRLTQGLRDYFDEATGVDISPTMIQLAQNRNRPERPCTFVHHDRSDLSCFADASFDFLVSLLVLQHIHPTYIETYVREFLRVLRPSGVGLVQLPSGDFPGYSAPTLDAPKQFPIMEMHFVPRETFSRWVQESGGEVLSMLDDGSAPPFQGTRYVIRKI